MQVEKGKESYIDEIVTLQSYIISLEGRARDETWNKMLQSLTIPDGPVEKCRDALHRLLPKVNPTGAMKTVRTLTFHFEKHDIDHALLTIERQKSCFIFAQANDHL